MVPVSFHEITLAALGIGTVAALGLRAGPMDAAFLEVALAFAVYIGSLATLTGKPRLTASAAFIGWFYLAVGRIVPALSVAAIDTELLAIDRRLFGETPAIAWQEWVTPTIAEILSAGYLSYHGYIAWTLLGALAAPTPAALRMIECFTVTTGIGMAGYLIFPAIGPQLAFPEAFASPVVGYAITDFNAFVVAHGSSRYDVFPSLHVGMTVVFLFHDGLFDRIRFATMLPASFILTLSTMGLRYHYAIDLIAGVGLAVGMCCVFHRRWRTCDMVTSSGRSPCE